jgi:hypothetical protein
MAQAAKEKRVPAYDYFELDFNKYIKALNIPIVDAQRTLRVTPQQVDLWRRSGRVPVPVWARATEWWGDQGIKAGKAKRVGFKPFMLPEFYGPNVPEAPATEISPYIEEAPVVPPVVGDATAGLLAAIDALARYAASVVAEKALLAKENFRLQRLVALFQQNGETESDIHALDAVVGTNAAPTEQIKSVMSTLERTISDKSLLRLVEERLPFVVAR